MNKYGKAVKRRLALKYFLLFALTASVFVTLVYKIQADRINEHLDAEKELAASTYRSIIKGYGAQADIIYYNRIDVPDVIGLYKRAWAAPESERTKIRRKLYEHLLPVYQNISLYHLKQLHFHLKNNESFLRFHRPEKFGDNLTGIRDTVAYVNKTHGPVSGFEEGRIFNGYRFVYPLFDGSDYLGSVEISISMQNILESIRNEFDAKVDFIIASKTVTSKVFEEEQQNYVPSPLFGSYLRERSLVALSSPDTETLIADHIRRYGSLQPALAKGEIFNFYATGSGKIRIITFIPVDNAISHKTVAYVIFDREHDDVEYMIYQSRLFILTVLALLALLFYLLCRSAIERNAIEAEREQLQSLIDLQKNIVILSEGGSMKFANRFFYETFKYRSLEQFLESHACICELFVRDERYFHLGKVPEGRHWLETLVDIPATKRIVKMVDGSGTPRIYTVSVNPAGGNRYIAAFTDISLTISNQAKLEQLASRDKLTGAYNREFLDAHFAQICHAADIQQKLLGVIMVDLDHFKRINDSYGHNRGDVVLERFVAALRQAIRQEDFVIRWGGEEFLLMMMVDSLESAVSIAEGVRMRIETEAFEEAGQITASFGVTLYREGESLTQTVARTDKALYKAKASGRNAVFVDETLEKE